MSIYACNWNSCMTRLLSLATKFSPLLYEGRAVRQEPRAQDIRQQLEGVLQRSPADLPPDGLPVKREESKLTRLMDYLKRHAIKRQLPRPVGVNYLVRSEVCFESAQPLNAA